MLSHLHDWAVNLFIALALVFFWCWDYPKDKLPRRLLARAERFVNWAGLWHGWGMFAPRPIHVNRRMRVELELSDGGTDAWPMVDIGEMGLLRAVWWGRHRKLQESLLIRKPTVLRASYCDWVARQWTARHGDDPHPVRVKLYWSCAGVEPPGSPQPASDAFVEKLLYTWTVPAPDAEAPEAAGPAAEDEDAPDAAPAEADAELVRAA